MCSQDLWAATPPSVLHRLGVRLHLLYQYRDPLNFHPRTHGYKILLYFNCLLSHPFFGVLSLLRTLRIFGTKHLNFISLASASPSLNSSKCFFNVGKVFFIFGEENTFYFCPLTALNYPLYFLGFSFFFYASPRIFYLLSSSDHWKR